MTARRCRIFVQPLRGWIIGSNREDSRPAMDEGMSSTEAPIDSFQLIRKLKLKLVELRALEEEFKAKIEKLEFDKLEKQNIINDIFSSIGFTNN